MKSDMPWLSRRPGDRVLVGIFSLFLGLVFKWGYVSLLNVFEYEVRTDSSMFQRGTEIFLEAFLFSGFMITVMSFFWACLVPRWVNWILGNVINCLWFLIFSMCLGALIPVLIRCAHWKMIQP